MGRIGTISEGTDLEKAVYDRALGQVLAIGDQIRDVARWKRARRWAQILRWWGLARRGTVRPGWVWQGFQRNIKER